MSNPSAPAARGRVIAIAAALIGLAAATAVIGYFNFGKVLSAIRPIGVLGFIAVIAAQISLFVPLGLAWRMVAPGRPGLAKMLVWGRLMREAASDVLPFSQLGGIVIAGRVAVLGGLSMAAALGSTLVDITVEIVGQLIYTLVGLTLLALRLGAAADGGPLILALIAGGVAAVAAVAAFIGTQKSGLNLVRRMVDRMLPEAVHHASGVIEVVEAAYAKRLRLAGCLILHLVGWFGSAGGTWLILALIHHRLPYFSVVAIESLLFAARNGAFFVPSALGVQEGAYALLGPLFGLPVEAALALSLIKRARDIAVGVPMLLSWQAFESRRSLSEPSVTAGE